MQSNSLVILTLKRFFPYFSLTLRAQRKVPKETPSMFRLCGGDEGFAPVIFLMLVFTEASIRVASETLESTTTFTRHFAFLKKAGENFHPVGEIRWGEGWAKTFMSLGVRVGYSSSGAQSLMPVMPPTGLKPSTSPRWIAP